MALIKYLFEIEKKPRKGLLAVEWVVMGYLLLTLLLLTQLLLSNQKARIEKKERNDRWASGLAVFFYYLVE